jgi:hypothetical protein
MNFAIIQENGLFHLIKNTWMTKTGLSTNTLLSTLSGAKRTSSVSTNTGETVTKWANFSPLVIDLIFNNLDGSGNCKLLIYILTFPGFKPWKG